MAQGGKPNSAYIMDSLLADLDQIKLANGYWSDVATVKAPEYPSDETGLDKAAAESLPALLVWLDYIVENKTRSNFQEKRLSMGITVVGILRAYEKLQEGMVTLSEDVRRVMVSNPQRNYPGTSSQNTWGEDTVAGERGGVDFKIHRTQQGTTLGMFVSQWEIMYRYPMPKG